MIEDFRAITKRAPFEFINDIFDRDKTKYPKLHISEDSGNVCAKDEEGKEQLDALKKEAFIEWRNTLERMAFLFRECEPYKYLEYKDEELSNQKMQYQLKCKIEAFALFSEWFHALWTV